MSSYDPNLVVSDYAAKVALAVSKFLKIIYSQSNGEFMSSSSSPGINGQAGYYWQASVGDMQTLLGIGSTPSTKINGPAGTYSQNAKWTTQQAGTPTYEVDSLRGVQPAQFPSFILDGSDTTINPSQWPIGSLGNYIIGALSTAATLDSNGFAIHDLIWNENDSQGSAAKSKFFHDVRSRIINSIMRAAQPLPASRQPVFLGTSSFLQSINMTMIAAIQAAELALVNSGQNIHFAVGNPFDSVDRGQLSHMTDAGDFNFQGRALFHRVRRLSEAGVGTTSAHQWIIGLGARIAGWTVPAAKTAYVKIAPDRNDDIVPPANFNASAWGIQDGSTKINILGCTYLNSTTFQLTLDGTPSAAAILTFCQSPSFFGAGGLPTCNFHTKLPYFPAYAQTVMKKWLIAPVPIQRLDAPLLRDAVAGINADNVQLGTLSHGGTVIITNPPPPVTPPPAITIATISDFTVGVNLTVSGTYAGAVPTLGYYVDQPLDASGNLIITSLSLPNPLTGGVWLLSLSAELFPVGYHTVTIVETNAPTVFATSNSFNVVAAVMSFTPAVFDPTTMKGQDFTTTTAIDKTVWDNVFSQVASGVNAGLYMSNSKDGLWITSTGSANSSTQKNGATLQYNWPQSGLQNSESGKSAGHGYGTFHIRARSGQKTQGAGVNGIMWRSDGVWLAENLGNQYTEIDMFEAWSSNGTSVSTLHSWDPSAPLNYGVRNGQNFNNLTFPSGTDNTTMRDYDMVWKPGSLAFYIDGVLQYNKTGSQVPLDYAHGDCNRTLGAQVVIQTGTQTLNTIQLFVANMWWSPSTVAPGTGVVAPPVSAGPSVAITPPSPFNTGAQSFAGTVSGISNPSVGLSLQWSITQPAVGSSGWVPGTITGASAPYSYVCNAVPVTGGGTAGTLWGLVGGTTIVSIFTATPTGTPVVVLPPTVTVPQPAAVITGTNTITVKTTGSYSLVELCWGDPVTAPLSTDPGWTSMSPTTFTAPVIVLDADAGIVGGLWYRIDGNIATFPSFTATPSVPNTIGISSVINAGVPGLYAGYPMYVYGSWAGPSAPPGLGYYVDSGSVTVAPPPAAGTLGLTVWVDIPNKKIHLQVFKNTGTTNTVRANLDNVYVGSVISAMVDGNQSTSIALPAVGVHTVGIYLDSNAATASYSFIVNPTAGNIAALPASATITDDGFFEFMIPAGLTQATHKITVVRTDDSTVTAQSAPLIVAAATGTIPVVTYPSVQSSVIAPIVRPGFNPNLNLMYNNEQFDNFWKNPRDWTNTVDLAYSGKGGVGGYRNQPSWRKTLGSYGQVGAYPQWALAFRIIMSVSARPGSSNIVDIFTNAGHDIFAAGEPFLFWIPAVSDDSSVQANTFFPFAGWNFPLKQILTIVDSTSSTWVDSTGTPIKNSAGTSQTVHKYGIQLPDGVTVPSGFFWDNRAGITAKSLTSPILYGRHNSFYVNAVTKQAPWQIAQMLDVAQYQVCANGGVFVYGGDQGEPTYFDYWRERNNFGDAIAYQFLSGEMEYVGGRIAKFPDPSLAAVETENETTGPWTNVINGVDNGVRDMIVNFTIPGWRAAVGPNVTIIVKGTSFGGITWALANFDIVFPNDGPYCFAAHAYARQQNRSTHYPDPLNPAASNYNSSGPQLYFTGDSDAQYLADALTVIKIRSGATIAGMTEFGVAWDYTIPTGATYAYSSSNEPFRARILGQVLSALGNAGHFIFNWGADTETCAKVYRADGLTYFPGTPDATSIEMIFPAFRNEAALANTSGSLTGVSVATVFPPYSPPAVNVVPTYRLSASNTQLSLAVGTSITTPIVLASTHAYGGTVTLSTSVPVGINVTLSNRTFSNIGSSTNASNGSNIAAATISATSILAPGSYAVTVTATDGTLVRTDTISLLVTASTVAPGFTLSPATVMAPVAQGASVPITLSLASVGAYQGTVTLSLGGMPTGVTGSFSTTTIANGSGSSVLTLSAASSVAVGNATVTVTATDGTLSQTSTITLGVTAPPAAASYSLSPMSAAVPLIQGQTAQVVFALSSSGGYTGTDTFSVAGLPAGVSGGFSAATLTNGAGSTTLTLSAAVGATLGNTSPTVTVTDGTITRTCTLALAVSSPAATPVFVATPKTATLSVVQGASAPITVTLAASGGYTGTDTITLGSLPTGITAPISNPTITNGAGSSTVTFSASATAAVGITAIPIYIGDSNTVQQCLVSLKVVASVVAATPVSVDPQNPVYTSTAAGFSGHYADPTKTLQIEYLASGVATPADKTLVSAVVNSNGSWAVTGVPVGPSGASGTLWAIVGGSTAVALETFVPIDPPVVVPPVVTALKVGPTIVSTDGSGTYSLGCGAVSGGVAPLSFQFQRVLYSGGVTGPTQPIGPNGPLTTYQDASLPPNSTAGYSITVTDSSTPPQTITTAPNVVTYGTPTGGSTNGITLDQLSAQLNLVLGNTQTLVSNDANKPSGSF